MNCDDTSDFCMMLVKLINLDQHERKSTRGVEVIRRTAGGITVGSSVYLIQVHSAKPLQISVADMSCMAVSNGLQDISKDTLHLADQSSSFQFLSKFPLIQSCLSKPP